MTGSIAPNRPGHHGTVVARTVGTVAISCNVYVCMYVCMYLLTVCTLRLLIPQRMYFSLGPITMKSAMRIDQD